MDSVIFSLNNSFSYTCCYKYFVANVSKLFEYQAENYKKR